MFEKITDNVEIHQTLPDTPNMTTQELKITWDKGCKIIKEAFNKLVDKLNDTKITKTVLYENEAGISTGSFELNDDKTNYEKLDFYDIDGNFIGSCLSDCSNICLSHINQAMNYGLEVVKFFPAKQYGAGSMASMLCLAG